MSRTTIGLAMVVLALMLSDSARSQTAQPARTAAPAAKAAPKAAPKAAASAPKAAAKPTTTAASSPQDDEKAIRRAADTFAAAYNAHDARALAALFTADAEIVNEAGQALQGRAQIEDEFAAIFEDHPQAQVEVAIKSVRLLGPTVAAEDGSTTVIHEPGGPPERNRYTVIHVKNDGKWLMASARDLTEESSVSELDQLKWMLGEWVDESEDALVTTDTKWTDDHHFLISEFTVQAAGRPLMQGSQRIGWDPLARVIRSWVFDSEGGFAEGIYSRDGDRWTVKLAGVTRDGKIASATNVYTKLGRDRMTWQSYDRTVAGEPQADVDEVIVVRKPPQAK